MNKKIRSIYAELQGYLNEAPNTKDDKTPTDIFSKQSNDTIDELNEITKNNYDKFKIESKYYSNSIGGGSYIDTYTYRNKLNALIRKIHSEFFLDEQDPFTKTPDNKTSNIITQHQQQSQSIEIQIISEIMEKIGEKNQKYKDGTPEKKFLEKLKESIKSVNGVMGAINLIIKTAGNFGLTLNQISQILS